MILALIKVFFPVLTKCDTVSRPTLDYLVRIHGIRNIRAVCITEDFGLVHPVVVEEITLPPLHIVTVRFVPCADPHQGEVREVMPVHVYQPDFHFATEKYTPSISYAGIPKSW